MNIPTLDFGGTQFTDDNGMLTDVAQKFMDILVQVLMLNVGPEGFVVPSLSLSNINIVQNNQDLQGNYTCQFGTMVYDTDNNQLKVALNNGSGIPIFKIVTTS